MNNQLRIDSLSVENYRCFKKMDIPILFQPDLTVLTSRNGEGKTALLDAVKIAFGTFTSSFPITSHANLQSSDAHITAAPSIQINSQPQSVNNLILKHLTSQSEIMSTHPIGSVRS